ncbi:MarR family winged helix-turn-helix transcriptional regulator [Photobacterium alginatilyticum]|uniref:MarR family winged helix-turn-helix transcriptional regulator n=1 Tax=Photobacterium alginatilyticum TaxID=1775171 RepID=UPI004067ED3D
MTTSKNVPETIFSLTRSYRGAIKKAINANELGLNGMIVRCLHIIQDSPQCTANTIVTRMGRDKAQIARLVKEMIASDLISKHPNPEDKRSQLLALSLQGKSLMEQIQVAETEIDKQMRVGLTDEEVETFQRVASAMANNLRNTK